MILRNSFIIILVCNFLNAVELSDSLRLDGYANITGQKIDKENVDSLQINGGLQGRYQFSDNISFTGHIYFEEDKDSNNLIDYDEDIKWLYADYYLGNETTLRAGKFQFPIFSTAEIGTIGYYRTWTENPISSYGAFGYENFIGAEVIKNFFYDDYDFTLQLSYGNSENELNSVNNDDTVTGEAEHIGGIALKSSNDWFMLNIGYMRALSSINNKKRDTYEDANFNMYAVEAQADFENFSFKAGFITAKLSSIFPDEERYYTSIEYNYKDFTPYIYYANEKLDFNKNASENLRASSTLNETKKYSAGVRYDFSRNISFKLSYIKETETIKYDNNTENKNGNEIFKGTINVLF